MPLAAGLALLLYLLLGQRALHGLDVQTLVHKVAIGDLDHPYHYLYLRLVAVVADLLAPFSVPVYDATVIASALGTAAGLLFLGLAAARLAPVLCPTRPPVLALALVGTSPGVVFFATISEIHGVFFAFSGLSFWAAAGVVRTHSLARAISLGATTGLASCVHATGHLQWVLIALGVLVWSPAGWRRLTAPLLLSGILHAGVAILLAAWLRGDQALSGQTGFLLSVLPEPGRFWLLPWTLWAEWLVPFLPLSLLVFCALRVPALRPQVWVFCISLLMYLVVSFLLLHGTTERGAYLLPLVFPAALLAMQTFSTRVLMGGLALGLALAVITVRQHDRLADPDDFGIGVAAAHDRAPLALVCSGREEVDPLTRIAPAVQRWTLYDLVEPTRAWIKDDEEFSGFMALVISDLHRRGRRFVISDGAIRLLEQGANPRLQAWLQGAGTTAHIQQRVIERGFAGTAFVPR